MNTRSLVFRLILWYATLLTIAFALVGTVTLFGVEQYVENNLENTLARRAQQAAEIVSHAVDTSDVKKIIATEIEDRLTPEFSNRFVRITNPDDNELYRSGAPADHSFNPALFSERLSNQSSSPYKILLDRNTLLVAVTRVATARGIYTIEVGSSLEQIQSVEDHLLTLALLMLPVLIGVAVGSGYFLVNRALKPVSNIARHAEQITHHNLSERLDVTPTGDELERLSVSLNRMIARLDEAFQNSRRFLADASHELRTPLTIIKGELEELALRRRNVLQLDRETQDKIGNVLEEMQRLIVIVEGLFALSRLDAGEAQREWVTFNLVELVATTADQMKLLADDAGLTIQYATQQSISVTGDRSRLKQVVVNLIDNAIKYTPLGGSIWLQVNSVHNQAHLEISDTGIGIPAEALPRVFDRFFRVDKARSRGGAGLGLAIVKSICLAHGGNIFVESQLGKGSRFTISLPLAKTIASETYSTVHAETDIRNRAEVSTTSIVNTNTLESTE